MKNNILLAIVIVLVFLVVGNTADAPALRISGVVAGSGTGDGRSGSAGRGNTGIVREVTAYNVGVRNQTSDTPCIGAMGLDLCRLVDQGWKVCAANFVELGTILKIQEHGECHVLDRMNRRYAHRVDIAMGKDEVERATGFGLQRRVVEVGYQSQ